MEQKTKVHAEDGQHDLLITREFELPLELLFKAYSEAELVEQWMGTKVIKLENKKDGGYRFETTDSKGNKHNFRGAIHEFIPNQKITRTFEFEKMPFGVQLELLEFTKLSNETSKLTIHTVYESVAKRDQMLKLPFAFGINMAHNQLQVLMSKLRSQ